MYDYSYETYNMLDSAASGTAFGIFAGMSAVTWIISVVLAIFAVICLWKVFEKAGKPGWASIIPIYNAVVLLQIVGMSPWLLLLMLIPFANIIIAFVLTILVYVKLAGKFGKSGGFAVGLIFLNIIFMAILAFGDAEYQE